MSLKKYHENHWRTEEQMAHHRAQATFPPKKTKLNQNRATKTNNLPTKPLNFSQKK